MTQLYSSTSAVQMAREAFVLKTAQLQALEQAHADFAADLELAREECATERKRTSETAVALSSSIARFEQGRAEKAAVEEALAVSNGALQSERAARLLQESQLQALDQVRAAAAAVLERAFDELAMEQHERRESVVSAHLRFTPPVLHRNAHARIDLAAAESCATHGSLMWAPPSFPLRACSSSTCEGTTSLVRRMLRPSTSFRRAATSSARHQVVAPCNMRRVASARQAFAAPGALRAELDCALQVSRTMATEIASERAAHDALRREHAQQTAAQAQQICSLRSDMGRQASDMDAIREELDDERHAHRVVEERRVSLQKRLAEATRNAREANSEAAKEQRRLAYEIRAADAKIAALEALLAESKARAVTEASLRRQLQALLSYMAAHPTVRPMRSPRFAPC